MSNKFSKFISITAGLALSATLSAGAIAAPAHQGVCGEDYVVQANDWLSKLAEKQYGDLQAYPAIVDATNAAAADDDSYATIENPDFIEVGWKLCLPEVTDVVGDVSGSASFTVTIENIGEFANSGSGVFNTPVGSDEPGPLLPGSSYEFSFTAGPEDKLSFATMFVQSNDWFIGPDERGIALYDADGNAISGDITDQLTLWDSGTEIDQVAGEGVDQAPRQAGPDTGDVDPDNTVRNVTDDVPAANELVAVTLTATGDNGFTVTIENVSDGSALATPFAPGVWVTHSGDAPLFTTGEADRGLGLEALAEDGNPAGLAAALASESGVTSPLAPGVWAVHTSSDVLFTDGAADRGQGLEALAEDGNPADLAAAVAATDGVSASGAFNTPVGSDGPGPLLPGNSYQFTFDAVAGDSLSFATMFVQSNDLFYGPDGAGIPLFNENNVPLVGDITDQVSLWDAGTEANQAPGFGTDQAPRQAGPNTGADEGGVVQIVADGYNYPATGSTIRVTISKN